MKVAVTISPRDYDVVLFDLDGVLTRTASVHAAAWKGRSLDLRLTRDALRVRGRDSAAPPITLCVDGEVCDFAGATRVFRLNGDATHEGDAP